MSPFRLHELSMTFTVGVASSDMATKTGLSAKVQHKDIRGITMVHVYRKPNFGQN